MNLSVLTVAEWAVHRVELFVGAGSADGLSLGQMTEYAVAGPTNASHLGVQEISIILYPPNNRWVPPSLSAFVRTDLTLRVVLQCPLDKATLDSVVVTFAAPGATRPLVEEVKVTSAVAQWGSTLSGTSAGGAVGRVAAVRSIVLCSTDSGSLGPLGLVVPVEGCMTSAIQNQNRGTILGNLLLLCCVTSALALLCAVYAQLTKQTLRTAIEDIGVPSPIYPVLVVVTPSTVVATFQLFSEGALCAADVAITVIGVVLALLPVVSVSLGARMLHLHAVRVAGTAVTAAPTPAHSGIAVWLRRQAAVLLTHRERWRDPPDLTTRPRWSRIMTVIALEYSIPWYAAVDVGVLTVGGVIGASSTSGAVATCKASGIALLLLYVAQLVLCVRLRPMTTLFGFLVAVSTLAITIAGTGLQVYYLFRSKDANVDLASLSWVLLLSGVCDLLVLGVSIPKTIRDATECGFAVKHHAATVHLVIWPQPESTVPAVFDPAEDPADVVAVLVEDIDLELDDASIFDALFWTIDGSAIVLHEDDAEIGTDEIPQTLGSTILEPQEPKHVSLLM
jgi:hypothetical protein